MSYYWETPKAAVTDVIRTLERLHKLGKFQTNRWIRQYIIEAAGEGRIQLWATEDKMMAESYASDTPELIMLLLSNVGFNRVQRRKKLDALYGKPYVVTFLDDNEKRQAPDFNIPCGKFVQPERVLSVEPVDISKPDIYLANMASAPNRQPETRMELECEVTVPRQVI